MHLRGWDITSFNYGSESCISGGKPTRSASGVEQLPFHSYFLEVPAMVKRLNLPTGSTWRCFRSPRSIAVGLHCRLVRVVVG